MPDKPAWADIALVCFGIVYPALVYFLHGTITPAFFVILALALVALRLALAGGGAGNSKLALSVTGTALIGLALVDTTFAARAYPVLMSLAAAGVFGVTLRQPASLIERLALARGNVWSEDLRSYCWKVTLAWTLWLALNAIIAGVLAFGADDRAWALWTGLVSYLLSGALFFIEWLVRRSLVDRAPQ